MGEQRREGRERMRESAWHAQNQVCEGGWEKVKRGLTYVTKIKVCKVGAFFREGEDLVCLQVGKGRRIDLLKRWAVARVVFEELEIRGEIRDGKRVEVLEREVEEGGGKAPDGSAEKGTQEGEGYEVGGEISVELVVLFSKREVGHPGGDGSL